MGKILYRAARNVPNATAAGGSSYRQAKGEGKSDEEASAYSLLNSAANLAYGMFFEGLGMKEGNTAGQNGAITKVKEGINRAVSKVIKNPNTVKTIAALSKNMGEAAAQTFLQEAIDPILRNATLGESNTLGDILTHATSAETIKKALESAAIAGGMQLGSMGVNRAVSKVAGEGGLLNEANLKKLSDSDLRKVGDAVTNAYAETVKADPNLHVTDAQIAAYKKQSKKNMGSRENAISEILAKTDELKNSFSTKIEEAKGKAKEAGIEIDETASNKTLQGDAEIPNQTIEAETQTQQDSAELLKGEEETGRIKAEEQVGLSEAEKAKATFFDQINEIGRNAQLTVDERLQKIQEIYEALPDKGDLTVPSNSVFLTKQGFDKNGKPIYDWPGLLGFLKESIQSISKENTLP
ncbi:MAG: hypothetical protein ACC608_10455, partial [Anaerofustis sp.]